MLVLAGYETTGNALGFALYLLAAHPEQQARLVEEVRRFGMDRRPSYESLEELPFVEACLKEALRLYPPAPTHIRWGSTDRAAYTVASKRRSSHGMPPGKAAGLLWWTPMQWVPLHWLPCSDSYPQGCALQQCSTCTAACMRSSATVHAWGWLHT